MASAEHTTGFPLPSGGVNVGFVTNSLGIFLSALESATNTTIVANPKLLVPQRNVLSRALYSWLSGVSGAFTTTNH